MYKLYAALLFIIYLFTGNDFLLVAQNTSLPVDNKSNTGILSDQPGAHDKNTNDTNIHYLPDTSKSILNDPIEYSADDSLLFSLDNKKVFLYGNAYIKYQQLELKASYIELDMDNKNVYAIGMPDSSGKIAGNPVFKDGKETFEAKEMRYNFNSKKGIIKQVMTKQSNGYLHAERTKREANTEINMKNGKYTTCDLEHPHFYIALTEAKAIPNDKIVSGPAYMVLEDVPIYFPLLPFGFFPNRKGHTSGLIIPEYGEEQNRGFFLRNGGYYFAINDYIDYQLTGDFYTKGTWGTSSRLTYRKRYTNSGAFNFRYFSNATGDRDIPGNYHRSSDFSVTWNHSQDAKANPYNRFSANVNYSTSTFNENHARNPDLHLTGSQSSSISFSKTWPNKPFNFSMNMTHNQNNQTGEVNFTLPSMVFNVSRQYPFRRKNRSGKLKWYENIELSYNATMENRLKANDSLLIKSFKFYGADTGRNTAFKHDIPLRTNFKILNFINISPSINYSGRIFTYKMVHDSVLHSDHYYHFYTPVQTFSYAHGYYPSISVSANPTLYGMYIFKKGSKIQAIRHVIDPSIGLSFVPNMPDLLKSMNLNYPNYYEFEVDSMGRRMDVPPVSMFRNSFYSTPTFNRSNGAISLSLRNNVEMKVRTSTDTSEEVKKIKIIDNLNISTGYNLFPYNKKDPKWSPISINTSNRFFKDKVNVRYSATTSIYAPRISIEDPLIYVWQDKNTPGKYFRFTNMAVSVGTSLRSKQGKSKNEQQTPPAQAPVDEYYMEYVDFDVPWNVTIDYNFSYSKPFYAPTIQQTLRLSGNVNLTPKWKIDISSGYDLKENKLTYTSVNIYRDLHCWEARFNWVPFGPMKQYSFTIKVKESVLSDLKWNKRESQYDNR